MAVDTPAKIAIIGAGPVGLEAALYARYLGYDVDLYERGRAAEHLHRWGHARLFTPWAMNVTPLGVAALTAQDEAWRPAADDEYLTGRELASRYFEPLARCDLLVDCLLEGTEVVAVGREGLSKPEWFGDERRIDVPFRLLVRDAAGDERIEHADVVLDCSGTFGTPNHLGCGGVAAVGESATAGHIEYGLPDVGGAERERYVGRRTLLVGDGLDAATTVVALARLNAEHRETHVTWVTRMETAPGALGPVPQTPNDPLAKRDSLVQRANLLVVQEGGPVEHRPATHVEAIRRREADGAFEVEFGGRHAGHATFDQVVACVGRRPDMRFAEHLQLGATDEYDGIPDLVRPEPDFYVLGAKSFGRRETFLLRDGHEQIRRLFAIVGDRATLNLYETHPQRGTKS